MVSSAECCRPPGSAGVPPATSTRATPVRVARSNAGEPPALPGGDRMAVSVNAIIGPARRSAKDTKPGISGTIPLPRCRPSMALVRPGIRNQGSGIRKNRGTFLTPDPLIPDLRSTHGSIRPAAHQWNYAGLDLRPDRHRLYYGVRHHRHGEFRPWRRVHGVGIHWADRLPDPHRLARHRLRGRCPRHRAHRRHGADLARQLDDRAHRLSAVARLLPPGAADLGPPPLDVPVAYRPGSPRTAPPQHELALPQRSEE